ncbi:hypothetical protein BJ138DRAFT_1161418 [Hygrophoropsis aurantiaca]|uniref:Uncharacterized protein n=1 Tax=Hygrophoropsis aurantiaca TaxID=72124 RepID=A0ACB8A1V1_9AGAM|nr:hypothetical protein BJ138DRAFT_1161418 [Hygrophoropsis aurantiaca]
MAWPNDLITHFARFAVRSTTEKYNLYGPHLYLLLTIFPADEHYTVGPICNKHLPESTDNPFYYYVTSMPRRPVVPLLFMEFETSQALDDEATRAQADEQMRKIHLKILEKRFPITDALPPKLAGISVMGTRFAVCEYSPADRAFPHPLITSPDFENLADTESPSRERRHYDILEEAGEAKIKQIADELKEMAQNIALE